MKNLFLVTLITTLALTACVPGTRNSVVVATGTCLGAQVAENPATQLYEAKFGYGRSEFAFVPGNTNDPTSLPDVLMEIRLENILKGGFMYQRVAVGKNAVAQPGAMAMFAKDSYGNLSAAALSNITQKINLIPAASYTSPVPVAPVVTNAPSSTDDLINKLKDILKKL